MYSFTKDSRLLTKSDFKSVLDKPAQKSATDNFVLFYSNITFENQKRLGLIVSKKAGSAVRRNYIKRSVREYFRVQKENLAPGDYIALARPHISQLDPSKIQTQIEYTFSKLLHKMKKASIERQESFPNGVKSDPVKL